LSIQVILTTRVQADWKCLGTAFPPAFASECYSGKHVLFYLHWLPSPAKQASKLPGTGNYCITPPIRAIITADPSEAMLPLQDSLDA